MVKRKEESPLDAVLRDIGKKFDIRIGSLSQVIGEEVEAFTTGNMAVDYVTGVGGLPVGRSVELYGRPSSGKTTTALQCAAELQKKIIVDGSDELILYLDYEHALDRIYAKRLGLDVEHSSFVFAQPDNFEQGSNVSIALIETGRVRLMLIDSVAAMTPSVMLGAEVGQASVALQARLMSDYLKKLNPLIHEKRCLAVFLNHLSDVIEMGGRPGVKRTSTPGGKALKHFASVRMEFTTTKTVKEKAFDPLSGSVIDRVGSSEVRVKVAKNKVGPPFRECIVRVRYGRGFDNFWSALQALVGHRKVAKNGAYHYFNNTPELVHPDMPINPTKRPYLQGDETVMKFADDHSEWRELMIKLAVDTVDLADENAFSVSLQDLPPGETPSLMGDEDELFGEQ